MPLVGDCLKPWLPATAAATNFCKPTRDISARLGRRITRCAIISLLRDAAWRRAHFSLLTQMLDRLAFGRRTSLMRFLRMRARQHDTSARRMIYVR